mgnify:CR=1 FL=1
MDPPFPTFVISKTISGNFKVKQLGWDKKIQGKTGRERVVEHITDKYVIGGLNINGVFSYKEEKKYFIDNYSEIIVKYFKRNGIYYE